MWHGFGGHARESHEHRCGPRGGGRGRGEFGWAFGPEMFEGGMRRRMFDGGELRLVLLKLVADEPRHGYELIRAIEAITHGAYAPSPGVVYPTLTLLDEMGLIGEQQPEGAKKRFAVTEDGRAHLEANAADVTRLFARLEALGEDRQQQGGSPVWRAMRNLGMAIRQRKARGGFSEATVHDVAAMIDELAQRIERLK